MFSKMDYGFQSAVWEAAGVVKIEGKNANIEQGEKELSFLSRNTIFTQEQLPEITIEC